ncbi:putative acetyltransferase [Colletotrichum gloeosporioides]|uniref:Putative acetyltransferase n=1 Tax=Colletotrichum gloeosporioides TaxID=474922 RepID=A0A8H4CCE5_COLGL|nr:putative acetyltransferase [Colletotrichum gloeosporioides]KAF3801284.1 putative acetyltransferase [Colletotrichum gloeosporioides]
MISGQPSVPHVIHLSSPLTNVRHDCLAPALIDLRRRACRKILKYNSTLPPEYSPVVESSFRDTLLREILGKVGASPLVESPLTVGYGCNIEVGDGFIAQSNLVILDSAMVKIGHRVSFGPSVTIMTATEGKGPADSWQRQYAQPVFIGDDCCIGANVTIFPGVSIGRGCKIAAGSFVRNDIPDFSVALGGPARVAPKTSNSSRRWLSESVFSTTELHGS